MAATERRAPSRTLALALLCAGACDQSGLEVDEPSPPADEWAGDEWGEEDEGPPADDEGAPSLDDEGGADTDSGGSSGDAATAVLVSPGQSWRYESGAAATSGWRAPDFDDSAWASGAAPFGQGFEVATALSQTSRLRASFELDDPSVIAGLVLRLRRDDGAIVWLNEIEVFRSNMPSGDDPGLTAQSKATGYDPYYYYHAFPDPALLTAGTNVLAISLHPHGSDDDLVVDAMLRGVDPEAPPDELSFRVRTLGYDGKYGPKHVGAIWIEDAQGFVRTLEVWGDTRREHLVAWRLASDNNDVDAVTGSTRSSHGTHLATWDLRDAAGTLVEPGAYRLRVEYTEANSNKNAAAGPQIAVDFELGAGPTILSAATSGDTSDFAEILLYAP